MAKNNKKILTEDLFNSEGNTKVTPEILNESKEEEMNKENEEDFKILNTVTENEEIPKVIEPIPEEEVNKAFDKLMERTEIKKENETNVNKTIKKSSSNVKTYGFNDESYYL